MIVKVIYLNGCFEYFYDIESITSSNEGMILHPAEGGDIVIDYRLKLEVSL